MGLQIREGSNLHAGLKSVSLMSPIASYTYVPARHVSPGSPPPQRLEA